MSVFTRLYRGETRLEFIGTRRRWYAASGVLILICILSFIFRGFNYGIEFKGGSTFQINVAGSSIGAGQASAAFSKAGTPPAEAPQVVGSGSNRSIVVNTGTLTARASQNLQHAVARELH